jgi:hypothetical protein
MIPADNNLKDVQINMDVLKQFDKPDNYKNLEEIFKDSIIVHIYKSLFSKKIHFEISEFYRYLGKKTKLDLNLSEYFTKKNIKIIFNINSIDDLLSEINKNNNDLLIRIQNFAINKLNDYYHEKKLFIYYEKKYPHIQNYIRNFDFIFTDEQYIVKVGNNDYSFKPLLSHVFIMDKIKKSGLSVNFNVRNTQLNQYM